MLPKNVQFITILFNKTGNQKVFLSQKRVLVKNCELKNVNVGVAWLRVGVDQLKNNVCAADAMLSQDVSVARLRVSVDQLKDNVCAADDMLIQDDIIMEWRMVRVYSMYRGA